MRPAAGSLEPVAPPPLKPAPLPACRRPPSGAALAALAASWKQRRSLGRSPRRNIAHSCACAPSLFFRRMSKAAANMAGQLLALELAPDGIPLVLLHPGAVVTDM